MDWKDIGGLVAPFAPTIGKVIGGLIPFPGAGLGGELLGKLIANQFGVQETPEAVDNAIRNSPRDVVAEKLAAAEAEAQAKWPALAEIAKAEAADRTAQSQAINETIRTEAASGVSWWHWRHLIGYLVILYGLQQIGMIWLAALSPKTITPADAALLFNATAIFTGGLYALLGYIAQDNTKLRETAITGERAPSLSVGDTVRAMVAKVVPAAKVAAPVKPAIGKPAGRRD
jgi:hypothetical protein